MRNGNRLYTYNQSLDKTQFKVRMPKIYNDKYQLEVKREIARISSGEVNDVTLQYANELRNSKVS